MRTQTTWQWKPRVNEAQCRICAILPGESRIEVLKGRHRNIAVEMGL
jgi:hypothetical protein